ncbi:MAG TPA: bifunctional DNA-formamidopyrimidine glycosylase/DNA-(apurinic or apyrimidinic site) lyase [Nocardioidaceae bacterium]|nr:bifunctional DNA-formamidopyrimidine glycosylase/DNA-(apurinic or apyrimidinic site) lyase [Nocardioidaceae bacterium]
MPELPEVEVIRRGLERHVIDAEIVDAEVFTSRSVRRHLAGAADFVARVRGRTLVAARRRGKFLWLVLDDDAALLTHLGMSGQVLVQPAGAPDEPHLRIRFRLADGRELRFVDQRTFGSMAISLGGDVIPPELAHIAPDPFEAAYDEDVVVEDLRRRRTNVKRALLDQSLVSGIGNIYADEALWEARLHYARPTETLRRSEAHRVLAATRMVMAAAMSAGGTSFDALYVGVDGQSGYFARELQAYDRVGEPCSRCGSPIRRDRFMNRSSFICPSCQPRPRRPHW